MYKMTALTDRSTNKVDRVAFRFSDEGFVTITGQRRERHVYLVDLNRLSILRHIPSIDHEVDSTDAMILGYLSYLYCLRLANTKMMRRLTTVHKDVVTQTKDAIFVSGDMLKYKIATLRCIVNRLTPENTKQIENHFRQCDLTSDDALFYHLLYLNSDINDFIEMVNHIEEKSFSLDVNTVKRELELHPSAIKRFKKQASYIATMKLRFLANGNRYDIEDFLEDLVERASQAYYWVRPFYSIEHGINYALRAMDGYKNCLIEYYNHPDRARTVVDGDGYTNVCRSFEDADSHNFGINLQEEFMVEYLDRMRELGVS